MEDSIVERARKFAETHHQGMLYGKDKPYTYHLSMVVSVLRRFGYSESKYLAAGWLHDVVEDTEVTLDFVRKEFGDEIASIVDAVTDEPGETRAERKAKTLPKTRSNPDGIIVKLADRIANIEAAGEGDKGSMYSKEHPVFKDQLWIPGHADELWDHLDPLMVR